MRDVYIYPEMLETLHALKGRSPSCSLSINLLARRNHILYLRTFKTHHRLTHHRNEVHRRLRWSRRHGHFGHRRSRCRARCQARLRLCWHYQAL
jgi:hypothetical protein